MEVAIQSFGAELFAGSATRIVPFSILDVHADWRRTASGVSVEHVSLATLQIMSSAGVYIGALCGHQGSAKLDDSDVSQSLIKQKTWVATATVSDPVQCLLRMQGLSTETQHRTQL